MRAASRSSVFLISIACMSGAGAATGQDYPSKPIRLVVPSTPGNLLDTMARMIGSEMAKSLGHPVVIENKPGAGQLIGYEYVAKQAPADGYTMAIATVPSLATLPLTVKDLRFDPLNDLPPVISLAESKFIFGSASNLSWKTFGELVAYARSNPGKLNYGTQNPFAQLSMEALLRDLGLKVVHVAYRAGGPYVQALGSGEVHMGFTSDEGAASLGDRFRALAVTGEQRSSIFRDAPTFAELGHPQIRGLSFSLNVPVGIPKAAFDKLQATASRALQQPEVRLPFAKIGLEIIGGTSEAAAKRLAEEGRLFADIAKKIGLRPQ